MDFTLNKIDNNIENNMLLLRNLTTEDVKNILNPTEDFIENVLNYKNIDLGIKKINEAFESNKLIAILVDNDVDGFASASMIYDFIFNICLYDNIVYMIHENPKAHGLTNEVVDKLIDSDVELLIIPDGGSNDFKYMNILKNNSIDVLVLDHHEIEITNKELNQLSNLVLINNQDGQVNNINLSGGGVTYKFIRYYCQMMDKKISNRYIDLVALSIVSDVCDMRSLENRYYYNIGSQISNITNPLILEFCNKLKKHKKSKLTIEEIGFAIAPYINAIIRCGDMEDKEILFNAFLGCEDLIEHKFRKEIKLITYQEKVIKLGEHYKGTQKRQVQASLNKIKNKIEEKGLDKNKIIILDVTNILPNGLKGLVCNKLLDTYRRPIFLTSKFKKDMYGGSSRGYSKVVPNLKEFCNESGYFNSLEGHSNSFGHTINENNIQPFIQYANKNITNEINYKNTYEVEKVYKQEIPLSDVLQISKYEDLWCSQIKAPRYLLKDVVINVSDIKKYGNATYKFMINDILFEKDFGSKIWFEDFIKEENNAEIIKTDILVEFRLNKSKKAFCKIIDTESTIVA